MYDLNVLQSIFGSHRTKARLMLKLRQEGLVIIDHGEYIDVCQIMVISIHNSYVISIAGRLISSDSNLETTVGIIKSMCLSHQI